MHVDQLYLDLNAFFASVEQQEEPRLRDRPVAVIPNMVETTCCIAVSYEAKAFGIKTGTAVWRARELCPAIVLLPARHDVYVRYHQRIHDEILRHVPAVAVCSIDEFTTTLGGRDRELAAARALADRIKRGLRETIGPAVTCSIGLAPNRLLAKIAGDMRKPDGLTWILPAEIKEKLAPLALDELPGIGKGNLARLRNAGVGTVSALLDLDPRHARAIWHSVAGERFLRALQGGPYGELDTRRRQISHSQILAPENRSHPMARAVARVLLEKATRRMRREGYCAGRLWVGCRDRSGGRHGVEVRLPATQSDRALLGLFDHLWRRIEVRAEPSLKKVSIGLSDLVAVGARQGDLFIDRRLDIERRDERLAKAVDTIKDRFGASAIRYGAMPKGLAAYTGGRIAFTRIPLPEDCMQ
ncbi:MAG: impB/mucB/samB family protein [Alphaproteobacteria bacterium]|nr:impB/mucB/samB family protein [Alphaproteobacteria bacterium]